VSFNGAGLFLINTAGQPVVGNTLIDAATFNAFTADVATGLSNVICKDGQTTPTANIPMGGFKITGLALGTSNNDAAAVQNLNALHTCEGRLTLTTAVPVTTSDVVGAATVYFTPYQGNCIGLYDGANWNRRTFSELSITNAGLAANTCYDVFIYDNAGTATIELLAWTNETTRATALTTQNGVLVKSGAVTRRYVGTIHSNAASQFYDTYAFRRVWNYYNRVLRPMRPALETTDTWAYTLAAFRQANGNVANQLDYVIGVSEDAVTAQVQAFAKNTNANVDMIVAIGADSTTTMASGCFAYSGASQVANQYVGLQAQYTTIPAVGRHTLVWLELSAASGTTTWGGDGGAPTTSQAGIHGWVRA
jgi:hypothetical protein